MYMILGWGLTIFLTIEYIGYCINVSNTRSALNQILIQVTEINNRNNRNQF